MADLNARDRHELKKVAEVHKGGAIAASILLTPAAYLMVGRWGWALFNFLTANYLFLGPLIVPFHVNSIIEEARSILDDAEESWEAEFGWVPTVVVGVPAVALFIIIVMVAIGPQLKESMEKEPTKAPADEQTVEEQQASISAALFGTN